MNTPELTQEEIEHVRATFLTDVEDDTSGPSTNYWTAGGQIVKLMPRTRRASGRDGQKEKRLAKRRAKNRVAKQARKRNRR